MHGQHSRDDADAWPRQSGKQANIADLVHGHFEHCDLVRQIQTVEHRQGQTDLGVQVSFRFQHAPTGAQHARDDFLGSCLAQAAGNAHDVEARVLVEGIAGHLRQGVRR